MLQPPPQALLPTPGIAPTAPPPGPTRAPRVLGARWDAGRRGRGRTLSLQPGRGENKRGTCRPRLRRWSRGTVPQRGAWVLCWGEAEAGCCAVWALAESPSRPIASAGLASAMRVWLPSLLCPPPPRRAAAGGVLWRRGPCCNRPRWVPKVYRATAQIRSSRELTPPPAAGRRKGSLEAKSPLTLFWGLNTVPPLVTLSPTSIRSYSQLSPAQASPLFLLLLLTSDSNPALWPIRFPPPTSDTTRGHSNKVPSTMSQRDGTFRAHKNWSHFPARETSLQAPGGITGITAEKIGSDGEEGS